MQVGDLVRLMSEYPHPDISPLRQGTIFSGALGLIIRKHVWTTEDDCGKIDTRVYYMVHFAAAGLAAVWEEHLVVISPVDDRE